jgi:hypothetical protein
MINFYKYNIYDIMQIKLCIKKNNNDFGNNLMKKVEE